MGTTQSLMRYEYANTPTKLKDGITMNIEHINVIREHLGTLYTNVIFMKSGDNASVWLVGKEESKVVVRYAHWEVSVISEDSSVNHKTALEWIHNLENALNQIEVDKTRMKQAEISEEKAKALIEITGFKRIKIGTSKCFNVYALVDRGEMYYQRFVVWRFSHLDAALVNGEFFADVKDAMDYWDDLMGA
jgi:hypothetical protein